MAQDIRGGGENVVDAFLEKMAKAPSAAHGGRLIFALDATASRQETWDTACHFQVDMFREAAVIGGLNVQLVYYRGPECRASRWVSQAERLSDLMERIDCRAGHTQIGKVIAHAKRENQVTPVQAMVFVGDAMEERPACCAMRQLSSKCRYSCFRKATTTRSSVSLRGSPPDQGRLWSFDTGAAASSVHCCVRSRPMPLVEFLRSRTCPIAIRELLDCWPN